MKKYIFLVSISLLLIAFPLLVQANANVIRWGVCHQKPGEIPDGEAKDELLSKYDAFFHGHANGDKVLYLTFDAGYEDGNTVKILDSLKSRGVYASFFLTGNYMKANPELVKRIVNEGHIVCNHSMTHPEIFNLSSYDFAKDLKNVEDVYREIIGSEIPKYYRPPSGEFNEKNLKDLKAYGYKTILWGIAYADWKKDQALHSEAFKKILPNLHPGAIILLHTTSSTNAAILSELIDKCHEKGYVFKNLDDIK